MKNHRLDTPLLKSDLAGLRAGDTVSLFGDLLGMRDAAHRRVAEAHRAGKPLPVDLTGEVIYYVGPAPAKPGWTTGPAGPTTSSRMDPYTPELLDLGIIAMIGKGMRSAAVRDAIIRKGAVYFHAVGGAAALIASRITGMQVLAYEDLGTEAIHRIRVDGMSLVVAIDSRGDDIYQQGKARYRTLPDEFAHDRGGRHGGTDG